MGSGFTLRNDNTGEKTHMGVDECHLAALRQFAYEALNSPELVALA